MMVRSIILLTGSREAPYFKDFLLSRNPQLEIFAAHDREDLSAAVNRTNGAARLIAFVTDVIVPANVLSRLTLTPYNIHPGPPEYPGSHADSFAIWEQAKTFGVTAHEIAPLVDSGPIVAVYRFPMPPSPERIALADLAYARATEVFAVVAAHCAECDEPMPTMPEEQWSEVKGTRAQFKALCDRASSATGAEAERLKRACGPSVTVHSGAKASNG
ncbi:formyltransferase family protein [Hyphococcus sp.]|jgi:methionyl-tRNA formyltransferase|uniref:formyltransferase family protein n=1 Tax=Hyphococcus sp. TaxID=2038636 RepID=UPI003D0AE952